MKKYSKIVVVIAFILALLMLFEVPISALQGVIEDKLANADKALVNNSIEGDDGTSNIISEIESERSEYSKTFCLENGNKLLVEYAMPVHYQNDQGKWINYDNSMKEAKKTVEYTRESSIVKEAKEVTLSDNDNKNKTAVPTEQSIQEKETIVQSQSVINDSDDNNHLNTESLDESHNAVKSIKEVPVYTNKGSDVGVSFSKLSSDDNMIFIEKDKKEVSWGYRDIKDVPAKYIQDTTEYQGNERFTALKNVMSKVEYESAFDNVDIEFITSSLGVKENIILKNKNASNSFTSIYDIGELTPKQLDDRNIALFNNDGDVEYYINAEYMYDSNGVIDYDLKLSIVDLDDGRLTVELTANKEWLYDSDRAYPVTIDPSFITSQQWQSVQCAYITDGAPNTSYGYDSPTGYTGTVYAGVLLQNKYRSLIKMNNLPSLNKGDMVIDATLNLYLYNGFYGSSLFAADEYTGVYEVTGDWTQSTVTWNNKPSFNSTLIDYVKFTQSSTPGWCSMNITKLVKKWYQNSNTNQGVLLKSVNESTTNQCAAFFSSNYPSSATPRPAFQITYRNNKGIEDYWSNTSVGVGRAGTLFVNDYSGALTFVAPIASTASPIKSADLSFVYNSYKAGENNDLYETFVGQGWKMSAAQTLRPSSAFGLTGDNQTQYPYVYTDADGTDHYFRKITENNTTKYVDEDGLDLELTRITDLTSQQIQSLELSPGVNGDYTNADYYIITDKHKNRMTFFKTGHLRTIRNPYNKYVRQFHSPAKCLSVIKDASQNEIRVSQVVDDYVTQITDPANRTTNIDYETTQNGTDSITNLKRINRSDGTKAEFTYNDSGLLTSVNDNNNYKVVIEYDETDTKKVVEIREYANDGNNYILGNKITFDRSKYNTSIRHSSGNNGDWGDSDDLITTYQFDNYGRTKSVQSRTNASDDLGAENYEYSSGSSNSSGSNIYSINRVTADHSVGANTYNHIVNHGFESSGNWTNAQWGGTNTFTGTFDTAEKIFGKKSYKINVTSFSELSSGRAYQNIDISDLSIGSTYTLSGYVKVTNFSGTESESGAVIAATAFNNNQPLADYLSETVSKITDNSINNGWRRISTTFTIPDNTSRIRVNIALRAATGTAYFDGIQLEKAETAGSYNLLENSSFEKHNTNTVPTAWTNPVGLTYTNDGSGDGCRTSQHQHGSESFKIKGNVATNKYISQVVPVSGEENDTYIVSGWAMADSVAIDSDNTRKFKISIAVHFSDGTQAFKSSADFNQTISGWQFVSKAFNLSDGTSATKTPVSIEIFANYSKEGNAVYFDNFALVKEPSQSYTYDSKGNLISVVSNAQQNSSMEYNTDNKLTKVLDPKGYSYEYTYNSNGYVQTAKTQNNATYTYEYDENGNVTQVIGVGTEGIHVRSRQTINDSGTSPTEYTVTSYDQRDQASVSSYNSKTGTLSNYTDPKGITTSYTYNTANDLLTSVTKDGQTVYYDYDSNNHNLTNIRTNNANYSFSYDSFGARTQTSVGNRTLATYTYNNGGLLTRMDYGNDDYVTYDYDKYGNTNKKYQNGTLAYEGIADNNGTITKSIDHINHLQYNNTYDSTDRLTASTITDTSTQQRKAMFEYNFDLNNNMSEFTTLTPSGHNKVQYTYGNDNLLTGMTLDNHGTLDFVYNGIGLLTDHTVNLTNPLTTTYTYHEITSEGTAYKNNLIKTEKIGNGDFWYLYHYDANNNINRLYQNAEIEANNVLLEDYSYDNLGQLTLVNYYLRNKRYKYDYDNGGNITEERVYDTSGSDEVLSATNTYTYDNTWKDLLIRYNGDTITYDEIGNPLSYRDGISFTWSNGRQLHSYTKNNNTITYTYDNNGMRLSKDVGNTHYSYLYQNGLLVQETIGDKVLDYSYTSGGQIVSVRYKTNAADPGVYYYYALNSRGDVVGLYDENGALYAKYTYDVWGNPISVKNASGAVIEEPTDIANIQSLRYRGYYYDSDTGFYYLQSRYYDPVTHRFINADGLVSTGSGVLGYNMFSYCENNPIRYYDKAGDRRNDPPPAVRKARLERGKYQRRKTNRDSRKKYCPDEATPSPHLSSSTYYPVTANYRIGYVDQESYEYIIGGYVKGGGYSINNYSPSMLCLYASSYYEFGIDSRVVSVSLGKDNIGFQIGLPIEDTSIEVSLSIEDVCFRIGWDKTTYDGNGNFSVTGEGIEVNGFTAALAAISIVSAYYGCGATVTQ